MLPFELGAHSGLAGGFQIFTLADPGELPVVFVEGGGDGWYLQAPDQLEVFQATWHDLRASALGRNESLEAIDAAAGALIKEQ